MEKLHRRLIDPVTKNKIDTHLSNRHDTISEEDIKNIKTNPALIRDVKEEPALPVNNSDSEINLTKEIPIPWNIIS